MFSPCGPTGDSLCYGLEILSISTKDSFRFIAGGALPFLNMLEGSHCRGDHAVHIGEIARHNHCVVHFGEFTEFRVCCSLLM